MWECEGIGVLTRTNLAYIPCSKFALPQESASATQTDTGTEVPEERRPLPATS